MGQYHIPVNISRREFFTPHGLGDGLKALEQAAHTREGGTLSALHALLMGTHEKRGGGDYPDGRTYNGFGSTPLYTDVYAEVAQAVLGRWAGGIVFMAGDYAQPGDIEIEFPVHLAYNLCVDTDEEWESVLRHYGEDTPEGILVRQIGRFTNITPIVRDYFTHAMGVTYSGDGWVKRSDAGRY